VRRRGGVKAALWGYRKHVNQCWGARILHREIKSLSSKKKSSWMSSEKKSITRKLVELLMRRRVQKTLPAKRSAEWRLQELETSGIGVRHRAKENWGGDRCGVTGTGVKRGKGIEGHRPRPGLGAKVCSRRIAGRKTFCGDGQSSKPEEVWRGTDRLGMLEFRCRRGTGNCPTKREFCKNKQESRLSTEMTGLSAVLGLSHIRRRKEYVQ